MYVIKINYWAKINVRRTRIKIPGNLLIDIYWILSGDSCSFKIILKISNEVQIKNE